MEVKQTALCSGQRTLSKRASNTHQTGARVDPSGGLDNVERSP